ncbi:NlpC/P60 family protein [Chitinophaga silvisoli]|uniref:NlpC/P60 family protein n=1 Tax=Chitinophaga silvisoli TaxID=2291814 RepID=A0A3E1NZP2_9BACT|nr:NlpC/P60 family protein [Chitinophaga silvisoli]
MQGPCDAKNVIVKRLILLLLPLGATITTAAQQKKKTKATPAKKQTHVVHSTHAKTTSHVHNSHAGKTAHLTHTKPGSKGTAHHTVKVKKPVSQVNPDLPDEPLHMAYVPDSADLASIKQEEVRNLLLTLVSELGKPYIRGAIGPIGFDCSGLINYGFNAIGMTLPRTAASISVLGQVVSPENFSPGDLLFFTGRKNVKGKKVGHVGMVYKVEDGKVMMIHSSNQGVNIVDITNSTYYKKRLVAAKRIFGPTPADSCQEAMPMNESKK